MPNDQLQLLCIVLAVASGTAGGVFFAFSTFVMRALRRLPPASGIAAMQAINVTAINPLFMLLLFGTGLLCIAAAYWSLTGWDRPAAIYLLGGSVIYLAGELVVTILANVPWNNALAAVSPDAPGAVALWTEYVRRWTAWNHVRTVAGIVASLLFAIAAIHA
jgi:uncharacterized membrane protein